MSSSRSFLEILSSVLGTGAELDRAIRQVPFGVYVDKAEHGCIYANDALLEQFGVSWKQFRGFGWARYVHPSDVPVLQAAIENYEHTLEPIFVRYRVNRPDGSVRWIYARVYALRDGENRHVASVGTTEDITEQRAHRLRSTQLQRLEAVGRLSARTAHDFNNILAAIQMCNELLATESVSPTGEQCLATIQQAVDQGRGITEQLLILSGRRQSAMSPVCALDDEISRMESLLKHTLGEGMTLELNLNASGAHVPLDFGQLGQVLINLGTNARDASSGSGRVVVSSCVEQKDVQFSVRDWGKGMSLEEMERASEPFFTTKEAGRGTGLGLSTVSDIVTLVGGDLRIRSQADEGTTITVTLPVVEPPRVERESISERPFGSEAERAGGAHLLIVEDNDALRQSMGYALAMHGYEVFTAKRIEEARARLAENAVDVIVCDVLLPDGNGTELLSVQPSYPIVFITGFAGEQERSLGDLGPRTAWLPKPFRIAQLLALLERVCEREAEKP